MWDLAAADRVVHRVAPESEKLRGLLDGEDVVVWGGAAVVDGAHALMLQPAPRWLAVAVTAASQARSSPWACSHRPGDPDLGEDLPREVRRTMWTSVGDIGSRYGWASWMGDN